MDLLIFRGQNIENLAVLYRDAIPQADNYNGIMPEPPEYNNYDWQQWITLCAPRWVTHLSKRFSQNNEPDDE